MTPALLLAALLLRTGLKPVVPASISYLISQMTAPWIRISMDSQSHGLVIPCILATAYDDALAPPDEGWAAECAPMQNWEALPHPRDMIAKPPRLFNEGQRGRAMLSGWA